MRLVGAMVLFCACGRLGFDDRAAGLGNINGVVLSEPGALVFEDFHYDVTPSLDGNGYAVAWQEFPPGSSSVELRFAVVSTNLDIVVPPTTIEIESDFSGGVRMVTGQQGYLLLVGQTGGTVVYAIDATGTPTRRATDTTITLHNASTFAATADGFLEIGTASGGVFSRTLDRQGSATGPLLLIDGGGGQAVSPVLARSGSDFIAMWAQNNRLQMRRLDATGQPTSTVTAVYDVGATQGHPFVTGDGAGGFLAAWDNATSFPFQAMHFAADGSPMWPAPVTIYDQARYHDTADGAGADDGKLGFVWVTGVTETILTNVELSVIDSTATNAPPARLVSDPTFSFCYPEMARGAASFGVAFVGDVLGSQAIFLAILPA